MNLNEGAIMESTNRSWLLWSPTLIAATLIGLLAHSFNLAAGLTLDCLALALCVAAFALKPPRPWLVFTALGLLLSATLFWVLALSQGLNPTVDW